MRAEIVDRTRDIRWQYMRARDFSELTAIMVHRIGDTIGSNAREIAAWFEDYKEIGAMPYHFIISRTGVIEQAVPLHRISPHAWRLNDRSIAVAIIRDEKLSDIPHAQWQALIELAAELKLMFPSAGVFGHTDDGLPGTTKDPNKSCPGAGVDMDEVRASIDSALGNRSQAARVVI